MAKGLGSKLRVSVCLIGSFVEFLSETRDSHGASHHPRVYMSIANLTLELTQGWTSILSGVQIEISKIVSCLRNRDKM